MCKNKSELNQLVEKYRKLDAKQKKLESELKEVKAEIIEYTKAKGKKGGKNNMTFIVFGEGYKISYITVVSHPLDTDKVRAFLGDRATEFETEKTKPRLDIR